jgi:hypothetical protein
MKRFICLQSAACSGRLELETDLEIFSSFFNKELCFVLVVAATFSMMI